MTAPPGSAPNPANRHGTTPTNLFWAVWAFGPGTYGVALFGSWAWDWAGDPPNVGLACLLVLTHLLALAFTGLVFVGRIPVGLRLEVLALLLYWLGLAGWLLPPLAIDPDRWGHLPRWLPSSGIALSATMTVVIPAIAAARRRAMSRRRS